VPGKRAPPTLPRVITFIKIVHSAIFLAIATSLGFVGWAAITGQPSRLTWVAL
jgi:hypothetical protein